MKKKFAFYVLQIYFPLYVYKSIGYSRHSYSFDKQSNRMIIKTNNQTRYYYGNVYSLLFEKPFLLRFITKPVSQSLIPLLSQIQVLLSIFETEILTTNHLRNSFRLLVSETKRILLVMLLMNLARPVSQGTKWSFKSCCIKFFF